MSSGKWPTLAVKPLSKAAFEPFGQVIETEGHGDWINQGATQRFADCAVIDTSEQGGKSCVHLYRSRAQELPLPIQHLECHPLGSQAFIPLQDAPWLVVVAKPSELPEASDIRAFLASGKQGINLDRAVWHHSQLSLRADSRYLVIERQGPGNNLREVSLAAPLVVKKLD